MVAIYSSIHQTATAKIDASKNLLRTRKLTWRHILSLDSPYISVAKYRRIFSGTIKYIVCKVAKILVNL